MTEPVVRVSGVRKTYGPVVAVDDISFEVRHGEIFGLIGPNGAGKTTTMECVEGLRRPDRGTIAVLGLDPARDVYALQDRIGVQLQQAQLQKRIKVREAVHFWAALYKHPASDGDRLLEQLGLAEKRDAWFMTLSGGQKQRLFIVLALINDPELVFLDELTTGLDPQARRAIWELIRGIRARGKTVFLTTHLMEEAEKLCDRVAIIEHGRVVDVDTPDGLVRRHCSERTVILTTDDDRAEARFLAIPGVETVTRQETRYTIRGSGDGFITAVIKCVSEAGLVVTDFRTVHPTLEDVFLKLTGHSIPGLSGMLRGLFRLTWLEIKIFLREPLGALGVLVAPVIGYLVVGRLVGKPAIQPRPEEVAAVSIIMPVLFSLLIGLSAVISLVTIVAVYREGGILKRLRATPLRPQTILVAHVLVKLIFTAVTMFAMMLAGRRYFPATTHIPLASLTLALLAATIGILSIGFVIASLVPTARFAQPVASVVLYPMLALSGLFFSIDALPPALRAVSRVLPLTYAVSLLRGVAAHDPWSSHLYDLGALAIYCVVFTAVSARVFRWE